MAAWDAPLERHVLVAPRFFQVPKKVLEALQGQLEEEEEEEAEVVEDVEGGDSTASTSGRDEDREQWGQFDDMVESWLVSSPACWMLDNLTLSEFQLARAMGMRR